MSKSDRRKDMRTGILKKVIAVICIMAMVLPISSEVLAKITETAKDTEQKFGITLLHQSSLLNDSNSKVSFAYRIDNRNFYRVYAGTNDFETTIVCLNKDGKFPQEDGASTGTYKSLGAATAGTLKEAYANIDANKSSQILWLIKNAVLPEDSSELKDIKLSKIYKSIIDSTASTENPVTLSQIKQYLTEDDLVFAYQCAIWQATNYSTVTNADSAEILNKVYQGNSTGNDSDWDGLEGNDRWGYGGRKGTYIKEMIRFYINNFSTSNNIVSTSTDTTVKPRITVPTSTGYEKAGSKIFVGPFKIESSESGKQTSDYAVDITFKDGNGKDLIVNMNSTGYLLTTTNTTSTTLLSPTKESLEGKEFYFAFPLNTKVREININLSVGSITTTSEGTVWVAKDGNNMQPLLTVNRTETPGESVKSNYKFNVTTTTNYDVALRKYIAAIYRGNNLIYDGEEKNQREPVVHTPTDTNPFNQQEYYHSKNPIQVEVGDRVVYGIVLYNEGEDTVRITQVIDHLPPSGIEFIDGKTKQLQYAASKNTECTQAGRNIVYEKTNSYICELTKGSKSKAIYLEFEVTADAKGKIVTNIAEITGMTDTSGNPLDSDIDSAPNNAKLPTTEEEWQNYQGNNNKSDLTDKNYYYKGYEDDDDFEKITVPSEKKIDLALRKSIETVNGEAKNRAKAPDTSPLTDNDESTTTSNFTDIKTPVGVKVGDVVVYTIRVFNEGTADGYASQITDYIPEGLGFIEGCDINQSWKLPTSENLTTVKLSSITGGTKNLSVADFKNNSTIKSQDDVKNVNIIKGKVAITTDKLSTGKENLLKAFDKTNKKLDIHTVQVACIVLDEAKASNSLRNIAAITEYKDENETVVKKDIDSNSDNDLTNFDENKHEDDEDFEKLTLQETAYDLALKKYVSAVTDAANNKKTIEDSQKRNLKVTSVDALEKRKDSTEKLDATYSFGVDKEQNPVDVKKGDYVTYTLRIYNEGATDAVVGEIFDTTPTGLEFISNSAINTKYGWKKRTSTSTSGWTANEGLVTEYFKDTVIPAFNASKKNDTPSFSEQTGIGMDMGVSYVELKIEFKVTTDEAKVIKNIAEITKDDGDDNDSTPDNKNEKEDDEDFDVIIPKKFDLSLRKFITKIDDTDVTDRVPKVNTTPLDDGTSTTAKYEHTKEPKVVVKGQTVIYTLRVYNEGTIDGYASEITDDLPEGITFLPNNETNKTYKWKMYDKDGKETDKVADAVKIKTNYGAKENGKETTKPDDYTKEKYPYYKSNTNLLVAYDKSTMKDGPDYIDVKVAFEVTQDNVTAGNKVIINTAEISKNTDKEGKDIEDVDSTPGNNKEDEDDIDKEYLVLKYFDLSLLKYVSKVIVTEDGVTKETETGYDGTENPEPIVKVELNRKKLDKTEVKYVYSIKITNEGEIEGYAKEIKDRIPDGLAFFEEDNTQYNWKILENGIVTTDYLKDTLLQPGESAVVPIVLRWTRSEKNLGQKVNVAEISKDYNDYGAPDIDSTPDNNKDGEDDQDLAIVVLSISTGSTPMYIALITFITALLGTGFYMIYKYVVKK